MDISLREVQKVVNKDPRVKKAFRPILYSCILIALGFIAFMVFGTMSSPSRIIEILAMAGGASILIGIVLVAGFLIRSLLIQKKVRAEVMSRLAREEEERLAQIKASMTPAEWEAYKLQLENNKLLKDIKRRGSQKNTTTTTYGFVDGG
jgi:predicted RND superfamily exporter protein